MSTQLTTGLVPTYTCPFCRRSFGQDNSILIGEPTEARLMRLAGQLSGHLSHEHKKEFGAIGNSSAKIAGWLYTAPFKHDDAELSKFQREMRLELRRITKRVIITDEMIHANVEAHLSHFSFDDKEKLFEMFTQLRDALDEVPPPVPA